MTGLTTVYFLLFTMTCGTGQYTDCRAGNGGHFAT